MKRLLKMVALLLMVTMLAGCATAYQKRGFTGGYHDTEIDQNHYIVYFDGNGKTSKDRVWNFWIYRCAQLTVEKGYTYFSLSPVLSSMKTTSFDADEAGHAFPAVLVGDANGHLIDVHTGGGGGGHVGGFIVVPGAYGTIVSWHSKAVVTMYGPIVPKQTFVIRAQTVLDMLDEYVKSDGASTPPDRRSIADASMFAMGPDYAIVNVHRYLLTHVSQTAPSTSYGYSVPSQAIQPARNGALPPPAPPTPAEITHASAPSAVPAPMAPVTALTAETTALNARLSMAQSVAIRLGCGAVQVSKNSTYIASCGSYSVVISCDGDQCRPMHTINAKSED